jgi:predicted HicB family RNase H-like nuclease
MSIAIQEAIIRQMSNEELLREFTNALTDQPSDQEYGLELLQKEVELRLSYYEVTKFDEWIVGENYDQGSTSNKS